MNHASLFTGIGGFDLAAKWMGWQNVFQVENDPFCLNILNYHFPETVKYGDIRTFDGSNYRGKVDVLSGGFPCQPFSVAGNRLGADDERALWPEMFRVIREIQPTWIVCENVPGIVNMELDNVLSDLESIGYASQTFIIPACAVGAIHRRDRVWIIANATGIGLEKRRLRSQPKCSTDFGGKKNGEFGNGVRRHFGTVEWQPNGTPDVLRTAYGVSGRVDGRKKRIKALGNAIVPQIAYNLFSMIYQLAE